MLKLGLIRKTKNISLRWYKISLQKYLFLLYYSCADFAFNAKLWHVIRTNKLLWEIPTTQIAKKYGVSDKAIGKWAKSYGIDKPPRGYWMKQKP